MCAALCFWWRAAFGDERGVMITNLSLPTPPPRRFWKRFALCEALLFLWCAHGGAHCKTACAQAKGKTKALHWRGAFGEWVPSGKANAVPLTRSLPPKAPRQWYSQWIAHAPCANRFAVRAPVRAPKEEHWQSTRPSASKNLSALQKAPQKACAPLSTFLTFFSPPPCAPRSLLLHLQSSAVGRAFRRGAGNPHSPSD